MWTYVMEIQLTSTHQFRTKHTLHQHLSFNISSRNSTAKDSFQFLLCADHSRPATLAGLNVQRHTNGSLVSGRVLVREPEADKGRYLLRTLFFHSEENVFDFYLLSMPSTLSPKRLVCDIVVASNSLDLAAPCDNFHRKYRLVWHSRSWQHYTHVYISDEPCLTH